MLLRTSVTSALLLFIGGCSVSSEETTTHYAVDGTACIGRVEAVPAGLMPVDDPVLLAEALGESGKGKLCFGQVYKVTEPVTVYRVWNSAKSYTVYGRWWSFAQPNGPRTDYRVNNGICPSWSALDRVSRCDVKVGSKIVVGPGQSAQCQGFVYDKSATNQVYISNDSLNDQLWVENCTAGEPWPTPVI